MIVLKILDGVKNILENLKILDFSKLFEFFEFLDFHYHFSLRPLPGLAAGPYGKGNGKEKEKERKRGNEKERQRKRKGKRERKGKGLMFKNILIFYFV